MKEDRTEVGRNKGLKSNQAYLLAFDEMCPTDKVGTLGHIIYG